MAVTKLVERCFISDLALVSSPEVACGFRYDSNHREKIVKVVKFVTDEEDTTDEEISEDDEETTEEESNDDRSVHYRFCSF